MTGVLLCAAPLFSQLPEATDPVVKGGEFRWFLLNETRSDVAGMLGQPRMVAGFGADYEAWQYQIGPVEEEGFSHQVVFRKSTGVVISVARNYVAEREVDEYFPAAETKAHFYPSATKPEFSVRVRQVPGDRLLVAMGVSRAGQQTGQILLIRRSALRAFLPWLADQLDSAMPTP